MSKNIGVILAGGIGSRMGLGYPKQFSKIAGKTALEHTISIFQDHKEIDEIIIVSERNHYRRIEDLVAKAEFNKVNKIIFKEGLNATVLDETILANDAVLNSNVFICDISGVVSEALTTNSPIFVYIPSDREIHIAKSNMSYEDYCYTFSNVDELIQKMKQVLEGNDYLAENRAKAIDYFISYEQTFNEVFIQHLKDIGTGTNLKYSPSLFTDL